MKVKCDICYGTGICPHAWPAVWCSNCVKGWIVTIEPELWVSGEGWRAPKFPVLVSPIVFVNEGSRINVTRNKPGWAAMEELRRMMEGRKIRIPESRLSDLVR